MTPIALNQNMINSDLDTIKTTIDNIGANLDDVIEKATTTTTKITRGEVEESMKNAIHDIYSHMESYL